VGWIAHLALEWLPPCFVQERSEIIAMAHFVHRLTLNVLIVLGGYVADSIDDDPSALRPWHLYRFRGPC
jgi:low temperature requirement protein LtrA